MKKYYFTIYALIFFIFFIGCNKNNWQPAQPEDLSDKAYKRYIDNLSEARKRQDFYQEAIALANLGVEPRKVHKLLNKAIKEDSTVCFELIDFDSLYIKQNFKIVLIKIDQNRWNEICKKCRNEIPESVYAERALEKIRLQEEKMRLHKERIAQIKIDSSKHDWKLIRLLDTIHYRDQNLRKQMTDENRTILWKQQHILDSLNLISVDSILKIHGFPNKDLVGLDGMMTVWLVLHHQSKLETRLKYKPFLEKAVADGILNKNLLDNYNFRTER